MEDKGVGKRLASESCQSFQITSPGGFLSEQSIMHPVRAPQPAQTPRLEAPSLPEDAGAGRAGWRVGAGGRSQKWGMKINLVGEFARQRCKSPKPEESAFGKKDAAGHGRDIKTNFPC